MRPLKAMFVAALAMLALPSSAQQSVPLVPPVSDERVPTDPARPAAPITPGPAAAGAAAQLTATDVNAFLDGLIPYSIAKGDIAGGVVVVVRDGQILTQRGYGFADVKSRRPVDPQRTLFRPGSVSKLFTWTAVMQQVEQGKLNLDADVNQYLDFKIPPYQGQPVTLRQLMKHTAGFEEQSKWIIGTNPEKVKSYDELLKRWVPTRIYAPGSTPAYSNYATSLAGYLVQRVSGENFYDYVDRHILQPIGMRNSTFRQPLPPRLQAGMATGYKLGSGEPVGFEYIGPAPAGSLSATGEDMGRFMIAHLQGGQGLLRPQTAQLMHRGATTRAIPALNGMELGFYETDINGREVIAHGGDTVGFHSTLHLFLNDGVGIFASFNSGGRDGAVGDLRTALFELFADRYFPAPKDRRRVDAATAKQHAQMMTGTFSNSRRSQTSFVNVADLLGQVKVSTGKDGEIILPLANGVNGQPRRWVEVEPFVWIDLDSHERLSAVVRDGKVVRFSIAGISPFMVLDRAPWYKNSALLMPLLLISLGVLFLTAIVWPAAALVRRRHGATLALEGRSLTVYRLTKIAAILILAALIGWALLISAMFDNLEYLSEASDPFVRILQVLSFVALIGGLGVMLWNLWQVWTGKRRWPAKVWSIVLVLAAAVALWVGLAFNLIFTGVNY